MRACINPFASAAYYSLSGILSQLGPAHAGPFFCLTFPYFSSCKTGGRRGFNKRWHRRPASKTGTTSPRVDRREKT
jgi:hypothetical protein